MSAASSRRLVALVALLPLAALLLPGTAAAGSEAEPEVTDPRDQDKPSVDLLQAWTEEARGGLEFHIRVAGLDQTPAGHSYFFGFRLAGQTYVAVVAVDAQARTHTIVAPVGYGDEYPTLDTYPDTLRDVEFDAGSPGTVRALIPWGAVRGFEPGAALVDLYAGTDDGRTGDGRDHVDLATSKTVIVLRQAPGGILSPEAATLAPAAGALAGGAVAGLVALAVQRRRR